MAKAKAKTAKSTVKPTSIVTFLLDRSGSMDSCKPATIESFNAYLGGLQEETEAEISFTFLQFDTQSLDKVCVAIPVSDAKRLTAATYLPRGGTPLIDAAVKTIHAVDASLAARSDKPKIVVCLQTDGHENASSEHTWEELRALVTQKTAEGWQFNFMGAGIDGYEQAAKMGVGAGSTMSYDHTNLAASNSAFVASAANTRSFVTGQSVNTQYSASQRASSGDRFAQNHGVGVTPATQTLDLTGLKTQTPTKRHQAVADINLSDVSAK
jgi:uncharacterized protein YegL